MCQKFYQILRIQLLKFITYLPQFFQLSSKFQNITNIQIKMKKFEQELQEKAHLNKIRNAKKTVLLPNKPGMKSTGKKGGEQAPLLLKLYQNKSYDSIPAYKLLRTAGLQQYTRGFIERGYGINLGKLAMLNEKDKNDLYEELKILPGHTVKLDKLITAISKQNSVNPSEYCESQSSIGSASHIGKNSIYSVHDDHGIKDHSSRAQRSSKLASKKTTTKIQINLNHRKDLSEDRQTKNSMGGNIINIGSEYGDDIEYEKQLARVLNEYTPEIGGDKKKQTYDFKMATRPANTNQPKITSVGPNRKVSTNNNPMKLTGNNVGGTGFDFKKRNPVLNSGKPTVKKSEVGSKGGVGSQKSTSGTTQSSKFIEKMMEGQTRYANKSTAGIMDLDLGLVKIRNLSKSFDGALMGSTIANIDIEELVYAFSGLIQSKVIAAPEPLIKNPLTNHQFYQKQAFSKDRYIYQQQSNINNTHENGFLAGNQSIEDEVGNILRESYLHPLYRNQQEIDEDIDADPFQKNLASQEEVQSEGQNENENQNQFIEKQSSLLNGQRQQKLQESSVSSFLGGESYQFGLDDPLKIFDQAEPTELDYFKPTIDSISNFIKNIVLAAKMEREISIMAAHYMETFILKSNVILTSLNYKRILVTCLLLASKIWDDQSFESPSFSRTFPEYTTVLLNQMEKQILAVLDYKLKLDKKQYAEIFFKMRQFVRKNARSCQNKRLDLKKIRELQLGLKIDYKSNFMDKRNSF